PRVEAVWTSTGAGIIGRMVSNPDPGRCCARNTSRWFGLPALREYSLVQTPGPRRTPCGPSRNALREQEAGLPEFLPRERWIDHDGSASPPNDPGAPFAVEQHAHAAAVQPDHAPKLPLGQLHGQQIPLAYPPAAALGQVDQDGQQAHPPIRLHLSVQPQQGAPLQIAETPDKGDAELRKGLHQADECR